MNYGSCLMVNRLGSGSITIPTRAMCSSSGAWGEVLQFGGDRFGVKGSQGICQCTCQGQSYRS
jgi:hypothetical protein